MVRLQIEKKLNCNLMDRKKEFDELVLDSINQPNVVSDNDDESEDEASDSYVTTSSSEDDEQSKKNAVTKRPAEEIAAPALKKKRSDNSDKGSSNEDEAETASNGMASSNVDSDEDPPTKRATAIKGQNQNDTKADVNKPKAAKKTAGGRGTGIFRSIPLSPELGTLMGADSLPRQEVVKKMWEIIKERNLYDPKNKQFAYCDNELLPIMRVKRFRTFAMLKYLKRHFLD